jgi:hypothetical protein
MSMALESPPMAKTKSDSEPVGEDEASVRFPVKFTPADHLRFKVFCVRHKLRMEHIGAQWILDRLDTEEHRERKGK